ncbi:MAG TPA: PorP/SprF family type IX secretion system membrane protein [Bacteroidia bacterium]|jgi:type IX secretion system PorP/SprF family membrane protein|nr:PorP/SprF family type IX secretion system membrane protein [Bacteroidia bacterium]HRG53262.1 PorP/SprF family type IX secretion system membrane protein [Bacteroidia bacterium]
MKNSIIKFVLLLSTGTALAQQMPLSSQYYNNQFVTNPALTGTKEEVNAFLTHRSQWTGVAGAPQTSYLTVDGPIQAKNIGLGLNLNSDVTDIMSRIGAFVNYSYKLKINDDDNNLLFGLAVGVINNRIDFSKVVVRDTEDPYLSMGTQSRTIFSADFGMAYRWKKLEIGAAVPQLFANKIKYDSKDGKEASYKLERSYLGSVKYVIDIVKEKQITLYPLVMVRYYENSDIQYDGNLILDWKKIGWIGATYHSNNAVAISAGVRFKGLSVGYAYDLGISNVKSYVGGSSELLLGFSFGSHAPKDAGLAKEEEDGATPKKPSDLAYDEALQTLKTKADTNEAELQRIKAELAQMKTERIGNGRFDQDTTKKSHEPNLTENLMRTSTSHTFVEENGLAVMGGYYIVIGSFNNKENANKFKNANLIKGYNKTQIIQNAQTKTYYVLANRFDKQMDAETELVKFKMEYKDAWVLKLE